jgi:hypothetical protein
MKKTIEAILKFLDNEYGAFIPECGSDFLGSECKGCKHYFTCSNGVQKEKEIKLIKDIFKGEAKEGL